MKQKHMKAKSKSQPLKRKSRAVPCQLYDADSVQLTVVQPSNTVVMIEQFKAPRPASEPMIRLRTTFEFFDPKKIKGWQMMEVDERIDAACAMVGIKFNGNYDAVEMKVWASTEKWYITF